ncbi:hypothetical protein [Agrobacterium tumefaciens]|nr:hypothetical protein [Agrobacterium tumefaciens]
MRLTTRSIMPPNWNDGMTPPETVERAMSHSTEIAQSVQASLSQT